MTVQDRATVQPPERAHRWPPRSAGRGRDRTGPVVYSVAIVDDQPISRAGTERLVGEQPHFDVVASVAGAAEFDAACPPGGCDVVILALPSPGGPAYGPVVAGFAKLARTVVASTWDRPMALAETFRAGARGCLTRQCEQQELLTALRIAATGGLYVCAPLVDQLHAELGRIPRDEAIGLAPREIETIRWIALGFTQAQIATRMGLSQATVNTYAKRIRSKLQVSSKAELTRIAMRLGYLTDEPVV
ncbi:LuxR C-terminal-related transcriptional regulator [Dactylosporangium sp. CA-092794]|uniref:LuxR C-terminal-related transcriptional regulator n=1 Tax=Dactylosporangium sp. CA-092794 TaxID=3239929 RepID=UPI003D8D10E5